MSRTRTGLIVVAACTVTALVSGPAFQAASGAEPDTTAPTGTIRNDFIIGSQLSKSNLLNDDRCDNSTWLDYRISYKASDASGISDYTVWRVTSAEMPHFLGWWSEDFAEWPERAFTDELSDYEGECGGGSLETDAFAVTAYDTYGNAKWIEGASDRPTVVQENGTSASAGTNRSLFTYSGKWSTQTGTFASGGRQVRTKQAGASVTFTHGPGDLAIVMAKGPRRGKAAIVVDGVRVSTVDTNAASDRNRIIVWARDLGPGTHTVKIRNLATAGHPRIDFDAIVY